MIFFLIKVTKKNNPLLGIYELTPSRENHSIRCSPPFSGIPPRELSWVFQLISHRCVSLVANHSYVYSYLASKKSGWEKSTGTFCRMSRALIPSENCSPKPSLGTLLVQYFGRQIARDLALFRHLRMYSPLPEKILHFSWISPSKRGL